MFEPETSLNYDRIFSPPKERMTAGFDHFALKLDSKADFECLIKQLEK